MKKYILTLVFEIIIFSTGFSQTDSIITKIKDDFQKWQPIIDKDFDSCDKLYNYAWGVNYQFDKWIDKKLNDDTLTLSKSVSIIEQKDLGFYVNVDTHSFSGDWHVATDYYYNKKEQLYFVFWRMNTFYAEEPLTVEKRLYFDSQGQLIRDLKSVFKMNTEEEIDMDFMDKEVYYQLTLSDMDFYSYWIERK